MWALALLVGFWLWPNVEAALTVGGALGVLGAYLAVIDRARERRPRGEEAAKTTATSNPPLSGWGGGWGGLILAEGRVPMEAPRRAGRWSALAILAVAAAASFGVLMLLFPASGIDTDPPQCFSTFGYTVPCGAGLSFASGLVVAVVLTLTLRRRFRPGR